MKKWLLSVLFLTGTLYAAAHTSRLGLLMPDAGDTDWDVPILTNYQILDSSVAIIPIDLTSDVEGTLPEGNLPIEIPYTDQQNVFTDQNDFTTITASSISVSGPVNIVGLTANQCVQTGVGGLLTTSGASCGGGSGTSTLGVNQNAVQITSPTKALNGLSPPFLITSVGSGATAQWALDGSSVTLFGNNAIRLSSTLQSGATFYVSSGTISGSFRASTVTVTNNLTADNVRVTGTAGLTVDNLTSGRYCRATTGGLLTVADADCNAPTTNYSQSFTNQTSVSLTHNAGTNNVIVTCYDNAATPAFMGFDSLSLTDTNSARVTFATPQSGTCVVASQGGGGDNLGNHTATKMLTVGYGISASTIDVSTITVAGNQGYLLLYSSTVYDTSGSSATTLQVYVPTKTSITITPKRTTSRIEISWFGDLLNNNGLSSNSYIALYRGSTNVTGGDVCILNTTSAGNTKAPCSGSLIDIPLTTSATTYTLYMKNDAGSASTTWNGSNTGIASMTVKEWGY